LITSDGKLQIFEDFVVDQTLPKFDTPKRRAELKAIQAYQKAKEEVNVLDLTAFDTVNGDDDTLMTADEADAIFTGFNGNIIMEPMPGVRLTTVNNRTTWYNRAFLFIRWWLFSKQRRQEPTSFLMTIEEFFTSLKNNAEEIVVVKERAQGYKNAILNAKKAGQHALLEKLKAGLNAIRAETQLIAIGLSKYLTEETVIKFYKQSPRGLRLDWVRNFGRHIPEDVVAKKSRADELGLFDNYVVLHYDPDAKSYAETEAEKARRKDPILFGVMKNRRILYYIGDWIDEYCDLTLDKLAEAMASKPRTLIGEVAEPVNVIQLLDTPR
jgi:hypothetical protein